MKKSKPAFVCITALIMLVLVSPVRAWCNGEHYSTSDPYNPYYGTHDYLAEHALKMLPEEEQDAIVHNLSLMLYGTEMPDNPAEIGDALANHHFYYYSSGQVQSDPAADRAQEEYNLALGYLEAGDWEDADKHIGAMTHYIDDIGVFGHVMGAYTDWGGETHHSDYEEYVLNTTESYTSSEFGGYIVYDGSLTGISAYSAVTNLAYAITFGSGNIKTCTWMDTNYDWGNSTFRDSCGASMNLAVNYVAEVLHQLYLDYSPTATNNSPTLAYGSVSPASGGTSTTFTYGVTYADADGDTPDYVRVYIDGSLHEMTKASGTYASGAVYNYTTSLAVGTHTYYFSASDDAGLTARSPSSGSSSGPTVTATSSWHVMDSWTQDGGSVPSSDGSLPSSFEVTLVFSKPDGSALANTQIYYGFSSGQENENLGTTDNQGKITTTGESLSSQTVYFKSSDGAYKKSAYVGTSGEELSVTLESQPAAEVPVLMIAVVLVGCVAVAGLVLFLKRRGGSKEEGWETEKRRHKSESKKEESDNSGIPAIRLCNPKFFPF